MQHHVELILMRQVATYLAMPVFVVDPVGNLVFYNEPAEAILGQRFEETGLMGPDDWGTAFTPTDVAGRPIVTADLPLAQTIVERRPAHGQFWIRGLDGERRKIAVTAFPLIGQGGADLGSVALFWQDQNP